MNKRAFALLLALILCLLCFAGCEESGSSLDRILEKKQIVFGLEPSSNPMAYFSDWTASAEKGAQLSREQVAGISVDIGGKLAEGLDVEGVFVFVEPEDALEALNAGDIDCYICLAYPDIKTAAQMKTYSTGLECRQVLIAPNASEIDSLLDVSGKKLAVVTDSDAQMRLDEATVMSADCESITACSDMNSLLTMLSSGAVDAAVVDEMRFLSSTKNRSELKIIDDPVAYSDYVLAFRLRDTELSERLSELYAAMQNDGTLSEITALWLGR